MDADRRRPGTHLHDANAKYVRCLGKIGRWGRFGCRSTAMAEHYSRRADLKPKMRGVVKDFSAEVNRRRTKVVKPDG